MDTISIRPELKALILEQVALTGGSPSDVIETWRHGTLLVGSSGNGTDAPKLTTPADKLTEFFQSADLQRKRNAIAKYLGVISFLYHIHGQELQNALDVRGHRRKYFSKDPDELRKTGVDVNPKRIPDTPYWAISRLSNRDKRVILARVLQQLGYPDATADLLRGIFRSN